MSHWGPCRTLNGLDALTAATPMWAARDYGHVTGFGQLLLGRISGEFSSGDVVRTLAAGSVGEVSALLILVGGAYLLWTKTANWRLVAGSLGGAAAASIVFRHVLNAPHVPPLHLTLASGGMLYACFFMVTDPVSAPRHPIAQFAYSAFIGAFIVLFRWKAAFAGGVGFAILLGNTVGPTLEAVARSLPSKKTHP